MVKTGNSNELSRSGRILTLYMKSYLNLVSAILFLVLERYSLADSRTESKNKFDPLLFRLLDGLFVTVLFGAGK